LSASGNTHFAGIYIIDVEVFDLCGRISAHPWIKSWEAAINNYKEVTKLELRDDRKSYFGRNLGAIPNFRPK
jgi:hypothetical protein